MITDPYRFIVTDSQGRTQSYTDYYLIEDALSRFEEYKKGIHNDSDSDWAKVEIVDNYTKQVVRIFERPKVKEQEK